MKIDRVILTIKDQVPNFILLATSVVTTSILFLPSESYPANASKIFILAAITLIYKDNLKCLLIHSAIATLIFVSFFILISQLNFIDNITLDQEPYIYSKTFFSHEILGKDYGGFINPNLPGLFILFSITTFYLFKLNRLLISAIIILFIISFILDIISRTAISGLLILFVIHIFNDNISRRGIKILIGNAVLAIYLVYIILFFLPNISLYLSCTSEWMFLNMITNHRLDQLIHTSLNPSPLPYFLLGPKDSVVYDIVYLLGPITLLTIIFRIKDTLRIQQVLDSRLWTVLITFLSVGLFEGNFAKINLFTFLLLTLVLFNYKSKLLKLAHS